MTDKEMLIPESGGALANAPSYATAEAGSSLLGDLGGESFPRLTFKGNRFRVKVGENEDVLDETRLPVILLSAYPKVSRIYFKAAYGGDDATDGRPTCASADGEVPLDTVAHPQSDRCATCPQNQKGSAISDDGGKRRACSYFKRATMFLPGYPDYGPVVTDFKAMSLFGDSYADKGLLNLRSYADRLAQFKTKPEAVITELSFDVNSSVPKVLFRATGYVSEELFMETIQPLIDSGQPEAMADTSLMRTEGSDDNGHSGGGSFRDKLLDEQQPKHAADKPEKEDEPEQEEPEQEELTPQQKAAITRKKNAAKKKAKEAAKAKAKAEEKQEEKADHPKFCGDCGAKWGTCEHTGKKATKPADDDGDDDEPTEFDDDLAAALAEFGGE